MNFISKLSELDIYFKYYELYKNYLADIHNQYKSLVEIREKIITVNEDYINKNNPMYNKFSKALEKIEKENDTFKSIFSEYNFTSDKISDNFSNYKILCYQFAKSSMINYLNDTIKKDGEFNDEESLIYFLNKLEMVIWDFFTQNFTYDDEILKVFDKAKSDIINTEKIKFVKINCK